MEQIALEKAVASNVSSNVPIERIADPEHYPDQVVLDTQTIPLKDVRATLHCWIESIKAELKSLQDKEAIVRVPPPGVQALLEENPTARGFYHKSCKKNPNQGLWSVEILTQDRSLKKQKYTAAELR